ncbi:hypothetical protein OG729_22220 [Streptomyces sp. NBC_00210]
MDETVAQLREDRDSVLQLSHPLCADAEAVGAQRWDRGALASPSINVSS